MKQKVTMNKMGTESIRRIMLSMGIPMILSMLIIIYKKEACAFIVCAFCSIMRKSMKNYKGDLLMDEKRLENFEKMLQAVQREYADIEERIERLKADGKTKSATYRQYMGRKMMYQNMLGMYRLYGLVE